MDAPLPEDRLSEFIDRYNPEVAAVARAALEKLRLRLPGAVELVYDNYNALAIGFSATERASDAVFSIALYPRWVTFFFLQGAGLPDPARLLRGTGKRVRHIVLREAAMLDSPAVQKLISRALLESPTPPAGAVPRRTVIKSVSVRQRPRRPDRVRRSDPASG